MHFSAATVIAGLTLFATAAPAQPMTAPGAYQVQKTAKVGGDGGFDYVYADSEGRCLYVARTGSAPRIATFNLDTLAPTADIPNIAAHGVATDTLTHHGFASSSPVAMWDTKTRALIKTIPVSGEPDGILGDAFNHRIYVFSHSAPNVTVLDAKDGAVLGTMDLGGAPEQAATDGQGHVYVDIEDKDAVAVIDAGAMKVVTQYSLNGKGGGNAGLALDAKNHVLFVACRNPQVMVMLDANTGKYLADLPIGRGCDGAGFNPATLEAFASCGDGTLTVIKENSPTSFAAEPTVATMQGAKTMTIDSKTGKVLLIAAEYAPLPTPAATPPVSPAPTGRRRGRRGAMVPGSFSILVVGK